MRLIYRPEALREIDDYLGVIRSDNPQAADVASRDLEQFAKGILDLPNLGLRDPDADVFERVVPDYPLVIAYRVTNATIEILSVFHTARDPATRRW